MDSNTFLVKLTNLIHWACITNQATIINFIETCTKISIIERIYNTGTVPTTMEEYQKQIILLDNNNWQIESLWKGFTKPALLSTTNWWDGTGTVFRGQGESMDPNTANQGWPRNNWPYTGPDYRFILTKDRCLAYGFSRHISMAFKTKPETIQCKQNREWYLPWEYKILQEARTVNQEVTAIEAIFAHKLQKKWEELNHCLIHLQQHLACLPLPPPLHEPLPHQNEPHPRFNLE